MLTSLIFYPSLGYNLAKNYLQPSKWQWYSRIDENIIVGALPFQSMLNDLEKEKVGGVVCCTEKFELAISYKAMEEQDWAVKGIKFHHVPMTDFTGSTSRQEVVGAVDFIDNINKDGKTVYIHCKAGRTRSATVAMCYLLHKYDYMPNVAFEFLKQKRDQVMLRNAHWRTISEYRRYLDAQKKITP
uniref:TYR_PHOSPHATASE_2 domain-containing protein n=1 Tax=Rhabditophanes sp. KR3021 TaxID=114890 RepID=A0AC35U326_9BILA